MQMKTMAVTAISTLHSQVQTQLPGKQPWLVQRKPSWRLWHFQEPNIIKSKIWAEWRKEWVAYPEGRQSHYFLDGPSTKFNKIYKHGRGQIARLVQYLTGHAFLRRHDKIVEHGTKYHGDSDECRLCCEYDEETPHHIITECPSQAYRRYDHFGSHKLDPFFTQWRIPQISLEFRELEATYD